MQTRLRLINVQGLGQMPKGTMPNQPERPMYYAHLLSFVPVDPSADGTPTGDVHMAATHQPLNVIIQGGNQEDIKVGGEYLLTLQLQGK